MSGDIRLLAAQACRRWADKPDIGQVQRRNHVKGDVL